MHYQTNGGPQQSFEETIHRVSFGVRRKVERENGKMGKRDDNDNDDSLISFIIFNLILAESTRSTSEEGEISERTWRGL